MIVAATAQDYRALSAGLAPEGLVLADTAIAPAEVLAILADIAETVGRTFTPAAWLIVEQGEVVGSCSIMRVSAVGVIDIGYGVAPSRQGRGFGRQAVRDIVAWAERDPRVAAITADTAVGNLASQRVLLANGFGKTGERLDPEDGPLFCWQRATA